MLLDLLLSLQLLPVLPQLLQLVLLSLALSARLLLCVVRHLQLILQALLHILGRLSLITDGVVIFFELGHLPPEFLAHRLSAIV